jgi:conjugal transfer pilus assembly protein TraD
VMSCRSLTQAALPTDVGIYVLLIALLLAIRRALDCLRVWRGRLALEPRSFTWVSTADIQKKMDSRPGHAWFGWGFQWGREHAQRLYDLEKLNVARLRIPLLGLWRYLRRTKLVAKGSPLMHGVGGDEHDIYVPLAQLQGHVYCPATTSAIKTSLLKLLAVQAIRRTPNETVVILDPKGGTDVLDLIRAECKALGRDFAFFHRAFPKESVRLDPLATWSQTSEVASRIAALIPSEGASDPWSAFGWRVLDIVVAGCVATHGERPTLKTIRRYVEGGVDQLLHTTLIKHFEAQGMDWRAAMRPYLAGAERSKRPSPAPPPETLALVELYKAESQEQQGIGPIDGLISMFSHNREHSQKMLASLIPILTMLTTGDLGELLSPDRNDPTDLRPILSAASIADSGAVVYLGSDALSNAVVAYAFSSIFMADLAAHAGARVNLGISEPRVNLFWDEANESVNIPSIQILNKARSAGYTVIFFSQTVPDFVAKLGSEALARQVLGNANSLVVGRTKDGITSQYVLENFGKTWISSEQSQHGTSAPANGLPYNFSGSYGSRQTDSLIEVVPPEALGRLPDLEYFASFSGSTLVKGRIPLVRSV